MFRQRDRARIGHVAVPRGSRITFGWRDSDVLIIGPTFEPHLSIALLDLDEVDATVGECSGGRPDANDPGRVVGRVRVTSEVARRLVLSAWPARADHLGRKCDGGGAQPVGRSTAQRTSSRWDDEHLDTRTRRHPAPAHQWDERRDANGCLRRPISGPTRTMRAANGSRCASWQARAGGSFWTKDMPGLAHDRPGRPSTCVRRRQVGRTSDEGCRHADGRLIAEGMLCPSAVAFGRFGCDKVWSVEKIGAAFYWAEHGALDR